MDNTSKPQLSTVVDEVRELIRLDVVARVGPDPSGELSAMSLPDVLLVYLNWCARLIPTQRREVLKSTELVQSAAYQTHRAVIDAIATKISRGEDLTPHLSRGVEVRYKPTAERNGKNQRRQDLDLLISEWGLHHLHLSIDVEGADFVQRTGDLLFVCFRPTQAFLIGVFEHGSWTNEDLVAISVHNWPEANLFYLLRGAIGLEHPIAAADRRSLRNAGVTSALEIDGKVYLPPGQSTAGTPLQVTGQVDTIMHALSRLENEEGVIETLHGAGIHVDSDDSYWESFSSAGGYGVRERQSGGIVVSVRVC